MALEAGNSPGGGSRVGVRVMRYGIWRDFLLKDWCQYKDYGDRPGIGPKPPKLAPNRTGRVYFTDIESVSFHYSAEALARRLTLASPEKFVEEGALVILFPLRDHQASVLEIDGVPVPTTDGGAAQWISTSNIEFADDQLLFFVLPLAFLERDQAGEELTAEQANLRARWDLESARLIDDDYWKEVLIRFEEEARSGGKYPSGSDEIDDLLSEL